jgi:hypothetical protein
MCKKEKKKKKQSWRLKRQHWRHSIGLDAVFQKTPMFNPKNRTVEPGGAFEYTAFEQWFENVECCREAALHLCVKQRQPTNSGHQVDSDRWNFHPLMPALSLVSLLEKYLWRGG